MQLLGHSETVWDSWCNCWDTPKQFGTVGAVTGTLIQKLFFVEASTVYNYFFIFALLILKPNIKRQKGCLSSEADSLFL